MNNRRKRGHFTTASVIVAPSRRLVHSPLMTLRITFVLALVGAMYGSGCRATERPDGGTGMLQPESETPALRREAHDGSVVDLRSLTKPALVYFYPKDDTPGCTTEACAFRDVWERYATAGVQVVGVSSDGNDAHRAFAEKYKLPFPLIADEDHAWAQAFGVTTRAGFASRVSFLLDAKGKVAKVYPQVDPGMHAEEVLKDVAALD